MAKQKTLCAVLMATVLLSGCAEYDWYKEGGTSEQKERQYMSCEAAAYKALPPNVQRTGETIQTTGSTNCEAGVKDSCGSSNKVSAQTTYQTSDVNAGGRESVLRNCMYEQGWREIEVSR